MSEISKRARAAADEIHAGNDPGWSTNPALAERSRIHQRTQRIVQEALDAERVEVLASIHHALRAFHAYQDELPATENIKNILANLAALAVERDVAQGRGGRSWGSKD